MQSRYSGSIRGLGIAVIVLSAISLLACLLGAVALQMAGSAFDASSMESLAYEMSRHGGYGYGYDYYDFGYGYGNGEEMASILGFGLAVASVLLGWEAITCAVSLAAGVMIFRSANDASLLGKVFGWSLAGAVASLLGGRLITTCVLAVSAVLATKDKNSIQNAYWQAHGTPVSVSEQGSSSQPAPSGPAQQPSGPLTSAASATAVAASPEAPEAVRQQAAPAKVYPQPSAAYVQAYGQAVVGQQADGTRRADGTWQADGTRQTGDVQSVPSAGNAQQ